MKKDNIILIWLTALWPLIFPLFINCVHLFVQLIWTNENEFFIIISNWAMVTAYAISGLIFAVTGFRRKEIFIQKNTLYAYITAGILAILLFALFFLNLIANNITNKIFSIIFGKLYNIWDMAFFAFTYTLYASIKAIIIYRKRLN